LLKWFRRETPSIVTEAGALALAKPWARIGTRTAGVVGGYFTVANRGSEADRLLSAASSAAESVGIHGIKVVGSDIRVLALPGGLAIPPDTTLELKPRGYHLQLTGLRQLPTVGAEVPVTLVFEKAGRVDLTLRIEDSGLLGADILDEEAHRGG
jgi:copper(I)-binding protein